MGIAPHVFLFAVFGHLRESKRLSTILRAFERARREADMALLVAGDYVSSDLARAMQSSGKAAGILRVGHTSERDFWLYAAACDACINLRYPAAGETSGIAIRLMGIGKPVIVSAGGETAQFPATGCVRVDSGPAEEEMLADYMVWLSRSRSDRESIGREAAAHIRERHDPARVASLYKDALSQLL
jgi:glycosyltransferase involved in cell wall biosynthesis